MPFFQPPTFARQNRATKYKDNTEQHISDRPGKRKQKRKSVDKEEYIERNQTENSTDSNFDEDLNRRIKGIDEPHENTSPSNNDTQPTIDNINSRDSRQSRKISKPDSIKSSRNNSLTDNNYNNNDSETTERQTAEQRKRSTEIEVKNAKQTEEAEDVEDTDAGRYSLKRSVAVGLKYYSMVVKCCYGINQSDHLEIILYNSKAGLECRLVWISVQKICHSMPEANIVMPQTFRSCRATSYIIK